MPLVLTYPVQLTRAKEGGFFVTSPVLSIFTQGETQAEALANAKEAILCHLEGLARGRAPKGSVKIAMISVQVPDSLAA